MKLSFKRKQKPTASRGKQVLRIQRKTQAVHQPVLPYGKGAGFIQRKSICPCDGGCPRCIPSIQASLKIGQPDDQYEQEADRVAERVMRMPDPVIQKQPLEEEEEELQAKLLDGQASPMIQKQPIEEEEEELQPKLLDGQITPLVQRQPIEEEEEELQPKLLDGQITPLVQRQPIEEEEEELLAKPLDGQVTPLVQRQPIEEEEEELLAKPLDGQVTPLVQRQPIEEEEEELMPKGSGSGAFPTSISARAIGFTRSGGVPLSPALRNFFEPRFGYDFSGVRLHHNDQAGDSAGLLNARAFTMGHDITFGSSEYSPSTVEGRRLIAHELTHVIQQSFSEINGNSLTHTLPEDRSESEAKASERAVLENWLIPKPQQRIGPTTIARDWNDSSGPEWREYSRLRRRLEQAGYRFRIREGPVAMPLGWQVTPPSGESVNLDRGSILQWMRREAARPAPDTPSSASDCPWDLSHVARQRLAEIDYFNRMEESALAVVRRGQEVSVGHMHAPMGLPSILRNEDQVNGFFRGVRRFTHIIYDWAQRDLLPNWRQHRTTAYFRQPRGSWSIRQYYNWLHALRREYITGAAGALATERTRRVFEEIRARFGDLPPPQVEPTRAP